MRVLLLLPAGRRDRPDPGPAGLPLGIASIAAAARQAGAEVQLAAGLPAAAIEAELAVWSGPPPAVVGFQTFATNIGRCLELADVVRTRFPEALVVLGGCHAGAFAGELVLDARVDLVAVGEGEITFRRLLERLAGGGSGRGLPGLVWAEDGRPESAGPAELAADLDELAPPARDLLPPIGGPFYLGQVLTFRGCPYRCAYCPSAGHSGRPVRRHSPARVAAEIRQEIARGARRIEFLDETFTLDREAVRELCRKLAAEFPGLAWSCFTRPSHVDRELLEEMQRAGCRGVFYGAGTGVERLGEVLETPVDPAAAARAVTLTRAAGLRATVAFTLGLPTESPAETRRTIEFGLGLGADQVIFQPCTPFPGTRLYQTALAHGRLLAGDLAEVRLFRQVVYRPAGRSLWQLRGQLFRARLRARARRRRPTG